MQTPRARNLATIAEASPLDSPGPLAGRIDRRASLSRILTPRERRRSQVLGVNVPVNMRPGRNERLPSPIGAQENQTVPINLESMTVARRASFGDDPPESEREPLVTACSRRIAIEKLSTDLPWDETVAAAATLSTHRRLSGSTTTFGVFGGSGTDKVIRIEGSPISKVNWKQGVPNRRASFSFSTQLNTHFSRPTSGHRHIQQIGSPEKARGAPVPNRRQSFAGVRSASMVLGSELATENTPNPHRCSEPRERCPAVSKARPSRSPYPYEPLRSTRQNRPNRPQLDEHLANLPSYARPTKASLQWQRKDRPKKA